MYRSKFILVSLLTFFLLDISGQKANYMIMKFGLEDGMSSLNVNAITQDKDGFIWIASPRGIERYDGLNFKPYITDSSLYKIVSKREIRSCYTDSKGDLWCTGNGVFRYNKASDKFQQYIHKDKDPFSLLNNHAYAIFEDSKERLWFGNWQGVSELNRETGKFTNYDLGPYLVRSICEDKDGNLWFGTFLKGAFKFDIISKKFTNYHNNPEDKTSIGSNNIKDIKCDSLGNVWIASWGGGVNLYNKEKDNFTRFYPDEFSRNSANNINVLHFDSKGNFWVGTDLGLFFFHPKSNTFKPVPFTSNVKKYKDFVTVNTIFEDKTGDLWVGSKQEMFRLSENVFQNIIYDPYNLEELGSDNYKRLYNADNSNILIVNPDNINIWNINSNSFTKYPWQDIIYQDKENGLWILNNKELIISKPYLKDVPAYRFSIGTNTNEIYSNNIEWISTDTSGHYWLLYRYRHSFCVIDKEKNSVKSFNIKEIAPDGWDREDVEICHIDRDNNLWLSYWSKLLKINITTGETKQYDSYQNGLSSDVFIRGFNDSRGNVWFTTFGGFEKYDKESDTFIPYYSEKGLSNKDITSMFEDKNGFLWLTTNHGLYKFDQDTEEFSYYTKSDGFHSNQFLGNWLVQENGKVILADEKGLTVFKPKDISKNSVVPPVVITDFRLFNKNVGIGKNSPLKKAIGVTKEIKLKHNQSVISFEFAILNFKHPEKNEYAYTMEGFEKDTNYVGTRNIANYTNLDPGTYTFRVFGCNNDNVWNYEGASINITILPPFWKTVWFRILIIVFIALIIIIIFQLRVRSIKLQKIELEKQVKERTTEVRKQAEELKILNSTKDKFFSIIGHDLKNPFYAINGLANILKERNDEMPPGQRLEFATMIEESSKNASALLENLLLWSRSQSANISFEPSTFYISEVINECFNLLKVNAEKKSIKLTSDIPDNAIVFVDKNMITTVSRNLINNALKFTGEGGEISIKCSIEEKGCKLSFTDNGVGMTDTIKNKLFKIDQNITTKGTSGEAGTGLGLIICKEFIDKNNGSIEIESELGKGSTFIITLPIGEGELTRTSSSSEKSEEVKAALLNNDEEDELNKFEEEELKSFLSTIKQEDHTIHIIEDNDEIRMNISQSLNKYFKVEESKDGEEGIEKAIEIIPDLIVSDVMMPLKDGFEVCSVLKSDIKTSHIPIILLTARNSEKSEITGINMGADDYITKPFSPNLLIARIKNLIQQREHLKEKFSKEFTQEPTGTEIKSDEKIFLNKAIEIIEENIENIEYSVEDFSSDMGMSYMQLYRKLDAISSTTPLNFIRTIRLKKAAELLKTRDLNVNEISIIVGFNDSSYFSKCFNEQFGMTPKKYALSNT